MTKNKKKNTNNSVMITDDFNKAIASDYGIAVAGYYGCAIAGDEGTAIVMHSGNARAGVKGTAIAGINGVARAGEGGAIIVEYYDGKRSRFSVGYVGEDGIKPQTEYRCRKNGEFEEA